VVAVRFSAAEHAAVSAAAEGRGRTPSAYLRELGLGQRRRSPGQAMALFEIADRIARLSRTKPAADCGGRPAS
jgi:hypothetical protein